MFSRRELQDITETEATVLLFRWHFDLTNPIGYDKLKNNDILSAPLQVMSEIPHEDYKYIREEGDINGRFAFD